MHFDNSANSIWMLFLSWFAQTNSERYFSGKSNMTGIVYIIKDYFNLIKYKDGIVIPLEKRSVLVSDA